NFPKPIYQFEENRLTDEGFKLGRKLFYENTLSIDGSVSCGSCHQQFAAFANLDHAVSHGVQNCMGIRNAPPIFNLAWQKEFMWDGGVKHIELSPLNALTNTCEMANNLDELAERLVRTGSYPDLFNKAFGTPVINSQRILKALSQFTALMVSSNSKYDKYIRKEKDGEFSTEEKVGYELFLEKCSACHKEPLFTDLTYRSNGLDLNPIDPGRDPITHNNEDHGKFRIPSLRNIELSGPYMHDGRFYDLEEVLEHYNSGVKAHKNLDPILKKGNRAGIDLSIGEQKQIITFLKTLTDHEFIQDKRFSEQ
ncbi:MAG: cytochrome-c peroxidase, partial [Daejeonella sp.]|nr:cytochrome-c peroxidase [Daejeonella sp.]